MSSGETGSTESSAPEIIEPNPVQDDLSPRSKVVTALTLCYMMLIYYMDRFGVAGLLVDIQCEFQVGDDEGGYLQSAFILSFIVSAPIAGYLGDRYSRKYLLVFGMIVWSGLTLGASFVEKENFGTFLALRALTGIGEACFTTMAPGMISDMFAQDQRTRYLALYSFCIPVGSGLGFIVASLVAKAAGTWRWGLRVTPILGFVAIFLNIFVVRDPQRGQSEGSRLKATNWSDDFKYLRRNWTYISLVVATTGIAFVAGAFAAWGPKFVAVALVAEYGEDIADQLDAVPTYFGGVTIVAAVLGVISGSIMSQKLRVKYPTADPLICAIGLVVGTPLFYALMLMARGPQVPTYVVSFFAQFVFNLNWGIAADMAMYVVVPTRRATSKALQLLANHVLGDAGSPFVIGLVSEAIKPPGQNQSAVNCEFITVNPETAGQDFQALQYSLFITLFVVVIATFAFFAAGWTVVADKQRVDLAIKASKAEDPPKDVVESPM